VIELPAPGENIPGHPDCVRIDDGFEIGGNDG
jgi:hypothetical protein